MSVTGNVTISAPGLLPLSFTWQASTAINEAASQAIELTTAQIHRVKSSGNSSGALLACLARCAAEGFLKATPDKRFASGCVSAICLIEGWTELLLVLNEHGQVLKITRPQLKKVAQLAPPFSEPCCAGLDRFVFDP